MLGFGDARARAARIATTLDPSRLRTYAPVLSPPDVRRREGDTSHDSLPRDSSPALPCRRGTSWRDYPSVGEQVGSGTLLSFITLAVDGDGPAEGQRQKRMIRIGSRAVVGYRAHLDGGATVGDSSMVSPDLSISWADRLAQFKSCSVRKSSFLMAERRVRVARRPYVRDEKEALAYVCRRVT